MKTVRLRLGPTAAELVAGFERIRRGMGVPERFPPEVEQEAARAAERPAEPGEGRADRRDLELLTIDPPESRDLDQAIQAHREGDGYRVFYAIADLGHFVDPGGALEAESLLRGLTLYSPDGRAPLYPTVLGEGAASLLPGEDRPAVLWDLTVNAEGALREVQVRRALVRSRRRLSYRQAQEEIDSGRAPETLQVLREVGILRLEAERLRGGVDLRLPDQQVERSGGGFRVAYRSDHPVERWNAQISLLTGIAAAGLMLQRGTGLLRTLPPPSDETLAALRSSAEALGLEWPEPTPYQDFVRSLDSAEPHGAAMLSSARSLFRGAGYTFFSGEPPEQPYHYAVAAPYAHVTAPLRRMADRLSNELLLCDGEPPRWLLDRLSLAPEVMKRSDKRTRELDSRLVDYVEAQMLSGRMDEYFDAVVVQARARGALVQLRSPAVLAKAKGGGMHLGDRVRLRLTKADPEAGEVEFEPVGPG
ncbi:MAG TPA: RNB domain-containing ribonuclease [Actinomycetota bacterium]|nr:RNB domain-containing ribonuclease [Actinomycetota bacterium]